MRRHSNSLPALVSIHSNTQTNYTSGTFSLPPPLESPELNTTNKENIPPIAISSSPVTQNNNGANDEAVPPLELLVDTSDDLKIDPISKHDTNQINKSKQTIPSAHTEESSEVVVAEECQESGHVSSVTSNEQINSQNNNNNNNTNGNSPRDTSYSLSSSGRLLASEEEWYTRAKVTFSGTDNGQMAFRPLRMKCTHCDEAYTKTHDLYAHIRSHQNHTKCPHCGKTLTCMATFVYHVRTHTAEKPYYCPCDGCDFKNAVKYNLKVHLACIRHGGKDNLKKYAKVLDLDVCEKSLRKRKDNSVHELGSRRSKRRRKMNMNAERIVDNNRMSISNSQGMSINSSQMNHHYPKQEECDQFAAQLLFSLSGIPPVFDQSMNPAAMAMDWSSIIGQPQPSNVIKSEQPNGSQMMDGSLKPEQYYDSLYGYYGFAAPNTGAVNTSSLSTSTIWSDEQMQQNNNNNNNITSDGVLIPKQEPMYPQAHGGVDYSAYLNQHAMLTAGNLYYGNGYYFNYGNEQYANATNANQMSMQQMDNSNQENKNKFELPPLQFPEFEMNK
eukprot:467983_1